MGIQEVLFLASICMVIYARGFLLHAYVVIMSMFAMWHLVAMLVLIVGFWAAVIEICAFAKRRAVFNYGSVIGNPI